MFNQPPVQSPSLMAIARIQAFTLLVATPTNSRSTTSRKCRISNPMKTNSWTARTHQITNNVIHSRKVTVSPSNQSTPLQSFTAHKHSFRSRYAQYIALWILVGLRARPPIIPLNSQFWSLTRVYDDIVILLLALIMITSMIDIVVYSSLSIQAGNEHQCRPDTASQLHFQVNIEQKVHIAHRNFYPVEVSLLYATEPLCSPLTSSLPVPAARAFDGRVTNYG